MTENSLDLGILEAQSPQVVAQLLIELSELLDGGRDNIQSMSSFELYAEILRNNGDRDHLILGQDEIVISFSAIFQFVLWSKIDNPDQLELILELLNEYKVPSGDGENRYLRVVLDTFTKTVAASKYLAAKMARINDDLNKLQQRSSEESSIIVSKMTALNQELNQLRDETVMDAEAFHQKLCKISADLDQIQADMNKQNVQVASSRNILNLATVIVIACLLGLIFLIWYTVFD